MIPLKLLGLGACAFLIGGCHKPPPPVINITIVMPAPAPAPPSPAAAPVDQHERVETSSSVPDPVPTFIHSAHGFWPEYGWRVITCPKSSPLYADCVKHGPAIEFIEQCHILAKSAQAAEPTNKVECEWMPIEASDIPLGYRTL